MKLVYHLSFSASFSPNFFPLKGLPSSSGVASLRNVLIIHQPALPGRFACSPACGCTHTFFFRSHVLHISFPFSQAPPRSSVVANLKSGLIINLLGLGSTLLGLQATVGVLVAKALTSSAPIYGAAGLPSGYNPVLALDVFLVQVMAYGCTALQPVICREV